jgi:hypothetical protein
LLYFLFCHLRHLLIAERKHHFVIHPARPFDNVRLSINQTSNDFILNW